MTTTNVDNSNALRVFRYAEIALYAILAAVLLGRLFVSFTPPFTQADALAVLFGGAFGIMAGCGATPLTAAWESLSRRNGSVIDTVVERTARILPFTRPVNTAGDVWMEQDDDRTRAA